MKARHLLSLLTVALAAPPVNAASSCQVGKIAELPITMSGLAPMVTARINNADASFIADSGAFYSIISPDAAAELSLSVKPLPFDLMLEGANGSARASFTTVKTFTLAGLPLHNVEFIVGGSSLGSGAVGLLGQNILRIADIEYDLANGAIRLMKPKDCGKAIMAYWVQPNSPYSVMDIEWATPQSPHTRGFAYVNGERIRVIFDTGAAQSIVTSHAADRAGVKPGGEGVVAAGASHGLGRRSIETWVGPFASFKIGDEEIRNTRLRFGNITIDADMLIGADFFLSHRVYVASSQRKLYFTYNGGPVFNLQAVPVTPLAAQTSPAQTPAAPPAGAASPAGAVSPAGAASPAVVASAGVPGGSSNGAPEAGTDASGFSVSANADKSTAGSAIPESLERPADAAGFSRRGAAFAARRDFAHAIADLTRACELAPNEAQYFYQRGLAYGGNHQPFLAMSDFDQALKLKPDDVPALMARAELRLAGRDAVAAVADLDAVDRIVPKEDNLRFVVANLYGRAGRFSEAIGQFDLWLRAHYDDSRRGDAFAGRCRARALLGEDLKKALSDCNDAVGQNSKAAFALETRGLVRLRLGDYDKSIADYNAAVALQLRNAWALYGRGIDELHKGMTAEGKADIAAATAVQPNIAEVTRRYGIAP